MVEREITAVLESYRDADGKMRYALKGAIIDDEKPAPKKAAAQKRAAPKKK